MELKPLGVQLSLIFSQQDVLLMIDLRGWGAWVETRSTDRGGGAGCLEVKGAGRASAWASIAVLSLAVLVGPGALGLRLAALTGQCYAGGSFDIM